MCILHLITANKALIAQHGDKIFKLAKESKTFFGFECPGCGITSSIIEIIKGNFLIAWEINKITFLVLPLLLLNGLHEVVTSIIRLINL